MNTGKNKVGYIFIAAILLAAVITAAFLLASRYDDTINGEFDISSERFQRIIDSGEFSVETLRQSEKWKDLNDNVGAVDNASTARKEAVKVWNELYGKRKIKGEKPYQVYCDTANEVWHVHGTLPDGYLGGTAHILIEKSGRIIAVWHEA